MTDSFVTFNLQNYIAKITDFGLAKLGPAGGQSHVTTRVIGTYGYAAPEFVATGHLYVKSDVYGFGVVLLEMLTGKQALDTDRPTGKHNLVKWAKPFLFSKGKLKTIMDAMIEDQYSPKAAWQAAQLTLKCLKPNPNFRPSMKDVLEELEVIEAILEKKLKVFSYADLKSATKNFRHDTVVGEGGFGIVYKGWLDEKTLTPVRAGFGKVVAIKKLKPDSMQGILEWQSEVYFLGMLSHPNLVKLLGYCRDDDDKLLLVYEFMPKGSLNNHLFRRNPNLEPLSWNTRLKIAIGAARALAFLHASEKQVIYRDFKASHILLDRNYNAKISDFGLAKLGPYEGQSHVTTRVMGTSGYAAPEYVATGHLYVKSDVYGFGVVLLEMLTSMRAIDANRPTGQHNLVEFDLKFV
ncbi:probable serine/threonine-protein kinase PIX13 [Cajanus cajan]|uniref:non-specific serine/threonine protein kinase n=1 Tax=Cajanus cajan TaxID=3821 RepID=A0A151RJE0_CAJCA|nr:probable serine/threonine-protein kinase PIX13 [Cajanus cajan]KYP42631.1 hypothetical protein KK1_035961 [Cajanus cajan]